MSSCVCLTSLFDQGRINYAEFAKNLKRADYPMLNTPETKSPDGATTTRHQEALQALTERKKRNKMVTLDQRVAEALVRAVPSPPMTGTSVPDTNRSGRFLTLTLTLIGSGRFVTLRVSPGLNPDQSH